jgi:hypothetical protein
MERGRKEKRRKEGREMRNTYLIRIPFEDINNLPS